MSRDHEPAAVSSEGQAPLEQAAVTPRGPHGQTNGAGYGAARRPFRAVDVLSGSIDQRGPTRPSRARKQISAQLEPGQLRMLGELHARLNATASERIEKSDLVGLGIELLAAALASVDRDLDPAPDTQRSTADGIDPVTGDARGLDTVAAIRSYVHTYVRPRRHADGRAPLQAGPSRRSDDSDRSH